MDLSVCRCAECCKKCHRISASSSNLRLEEQERVLGMGSWAEVLCNCGSDDHGDLTGNLESISPDGIVYFLCHALSLILNPNSSANSL